MNGGELLIGGVLIVVGLVLVYVYRQQRHKLAVMAATPSFTAGELEEVRRNPVTSGSAFPFLAEINGTVECGQPLTSQLGGEKCVAFRALVQREWEEQKQVRASDGSTRTETTSHTDTVSDVHRSTRFTVRDGSGAIEVDPEGCDVDMPEVFDRFDPADTGAMQVQFGQFSLNLGGAGIGAGGTRTRGYRAKEWALLPGQQVYVLGEVREQGGRLVVGKSTARDDLFIISTKSEKELKSSASMGQWLALGGAVVLLIAGAGVMVHALVGG